MSRANEMYEIFKRLDGKYEHTEVFLYFIKNSIFVNKTAFLLKHQFYFHFSQIAAP